ncbi:hypothetical protein O0I10_000689 [Lichtheimia ornata]|uniref:Uncharacterized protein n=1 Tax=Lichtheimia ornata TaxID=688661 RepID=A0AAD8DHQ3_9FUNG|nr:uncharacterized protein O0I10_000689 [Lichtheimia ornata]KAJ8663449.1 hypothetical protein O0I10_000689 [Lichtheimia ornata]
MVFGIQATSNKGLRVYEKGFRSDNTTLGIIIIIVPLSATRNPVPFGRLTSSVHKTGPSRDMLVVTL